MNADLLELQSTTNASVRNKLAIKLSKTKNPEVLKVLLSLINDPNLKNCRGTLVSCLEFYELEQFFELLINLVIDGNWEVAHEAESLLWKIQEVSGDRSQKMYQLISMQINKSNEDWRELLLKNVKSLFE